MRAAVVTGADDVDEALAAVRAQPSMAGAALAGRVSTKEPYVHNETGAVRVAVVDYGAKRSILRRLAASARRSPSSRTTSTPTRSPATTACCSRTGPGDPSRSIGEVAVVRELLGRVPVLGICLGHQLLALATGLETYKLPFGHRGANHPVVERATGRVLVTSQNHGFAVEATADRHVTHESLYDGTVEGVAYPELRARSVQFHPEAGPGPHDAWSILADWVEEVRLAAA